MTAAMRVHFTTVSVLRSAEDEKRLNDFLGSRRVVSIEKHFVPAGADSLWAICVTYLDSSSSSELQRATRTDYREVLPDHEFRVFVRLRTLRKEIAERDGVPAYAVFTNEQLAQLVQRRVHSAEDLAAIPGVGPARVEKYAHAFLAAMKDALDNEIESSPGRSDDSEAKPHQPR